MNVFSKGSLHNIYFFSAISVKDHKEIYGNQLYDVFTGYKTGVHFGGNTAENRLLNFDYLPYAEQNKSLAPGIGYLPKTGVAADTTKIVVPYARK